MEGVFYTLIKGFSDAFSVGVERGTYDPLLPMSEYAHWFDAIQSDDLDGMRAILDQVQPKDIPKMIRGRFQYRSKTSERVLGKMGSQNRMELSVSRPLSVAVLFGAARAIQILLQEGADPLATEENHSNVVHCLVLVAWLENDKEVEMLENYRLLIKLLTEDQKREILYQENAAGLRPLELAAQKGCLTLFKGIFQTPGVYLKREQRDGVLVCQWYDVTDYETFAKNGGRPGKSPLEFLSLMSYDTMSAPDAKELFDWMPIRHWVHAKFQPNVLPLTVWFLWRLLHVVLYLVRLSDRALIESIGGAPDTGEHFRHNSSANYTFLYCDTLFRLHLNPSVRYGLYVYLAIYGLMVLLFDLGEALYIRFMRRPYFRYARRYGSSAGNDSVVASVFFRTCQLILAVSFFMESVSSLMNFGKRERMSTFEDILNLITTVSAFASLLYFVQLLPSIGYYIVTVERMLSDLFHFAVIFLFCMVPFAFYYMVFFNMNSQQGCVPQFSGLVRTLYTVFTVMLNMVDHTSYDVRHASVLHVLHLVFVFVVAILMINFLIAVMSTSAARIEEGKTLVLTLERLYTSQLVEERLSWLLPGYYRRCRRKYLEHRGQRCYVLYVTFKGRFNKGE